MVVSVMQGNHGAILEIALTIVEGVPGANSTTSPQVENTENNDEFRVWVGPQKPSGPSTDDHTHRPLSGVWAVRFLWLPGSDISGLIPPPNLEGEGFGS